MQFVIIDHSYLCVSYSSSLWHISFPCHHWTGIHQTLYLGGWTNRKDFPGNLLFWHWGQPSFLLTILSLGPCLSGFSSQFWLMTSWAPVLCPALSQISSAELRWFIDDVDGVISFKHRLSQDTRTPILHKLVSKCHFFPSKVPCFWSYDFFLIWTHFQFMLCETLLLKQASICPTCQGFGLKLHSRYSFWFFNIHPAFGLLFPVCRCGVVWQWLPPSTLLT